MGCISSSKNSELVFLLPYSTFRFVNDKENIDFARTNFFPLWFLVREQEYENNIHTASIRRAIMLTWLLEVNNFFVSIEVFSYNGSSKRYLPFARFRKISAKVSLRHVCNSDTKLSQTLKLSSKMISQNLGFFYFTTIMYAKLPTRCTFYIVMHEWNIKTPLQLQRQTSSTQNCVLNQIN